MLDRSSKALRLAAVPILVIAAAMLVTDCGPRQDPRVRKARQVLAEVSAGDPQFAVYALEVAARSSSPASEQVILDHLGATDYQIAYAAARAAFNRPSPAFEEGLRALFSSKGGVVKIEAAAALAELGDEASVEWLRENLTDGSGAPSPRVVRYLAGAGEEDRVRPVLEQALASEHQEQRDQVYMLLGEIGTPWAAELALAGFEKERGEGRREAIAAIGKTGDESHATRIQKFINTKGLVFVTIEALGDLGNAKWAPAVREMLGREEKPVKIYAAVALWKLGEAAAVKKDLDALFVDPDWEVRLRLAEQLATVKDPQALSMLATLAEDQEPKVRMEAIRNLSRRAQEVGLEPILAGRLEDPAYDVKALSLDTLAMVGGPAIVDSIVPLMDDENPYVAISAANAVIEILARQTETAV
jgi:HEAT repeat protein